MALTNQQKTQRIAFADDYELAAESIGWVVPGRGAGSVVRFIPSPPQKHVFQTIREIQAFRYVEQARHLPKTERKEAFDIIWNRLRTRPSEPSFIESWAQTLAFGPAKAIRLLNENTEAGIHDSVRMMLGKPRQIGGTALFTWLVAIRSALIDNHASLTVAHKTFAAEYALAMVRRYFDNWKDREHGALFPGYGGRSDASLTLGNGATVDVETAGGRDIRAPKIDFLELDEYAHYDTNASVNAIVTAVQDHCWIVKNSTAKGVGGQFYRDWQQALYVKDAVAAYDAGDYPETWNRFFRCFVAWWEDPRYVMPVEDGEDTLIMGNLSDYEKAWVDRAGVEKMSPGRIKWRRDRVRQAADPVLDPEAFIRQEFPGDDVEMFQSSGDRPFDPLRLAPLRVRAETLTAKARFLKQMDRGPAAEVTPAAANLVIWEAPRKGAHYVIGADVAQGLAHRDRSWAAILERVDGTVRRQVGEWRGHIQAKAFAHVLALLSDWYNGAFLVPEVNGPGLATVSTLLEDLQVTTVYRRRVLSKVGDQNYSNDSFVGGFQTTQQSKLALIADLVYAFDNGHIDIVSGPLLDEMAIFTRDEKGRLGAPAGYHDDGVIALALANWGDNVLRGAPPITRAEARPEVRIEPTELDKMEAHDRNLIAAITAEIARLNTPGGGLQHRAWWLK